LKRALTPFIPATAGIQDWVPAFAGTNGDWRIRPNALLALAAFFLLANCSGDFGQLKPELVSPGIHDWVAEDSTGSIRSAFQLTDDERQLRDLAYPLIEPPQLRQDFESLPREYGRLPKQYHSGDDTTAYAAWLVSYPARSPSSRYMRTIDDIRNDTTRLPAFFQTAARVADMDNKRERAFAYIAVTSPGERAEARRRMNENAAIVAQVRGSLARRIASYKFALERLIIMSPSAQAAQVELMINQLRDTIARYQNGAPLYRAESSLARNN
jgi:hypothetical protein